MKLLITLLLSLLLLFSCETIDKQIEPETIMETTTNITSEDVVVEEPNTNLETIDNEEKEPAHVSTIRTWYNTINDSIKEYTKTDHQDIDAYKDLSPDNYAMEGANIFQLVTINLTKYHKQHALMKAVVTFEGYQEDLTSEYYYWNNALFFVFKKSVVYDKNKTQEQFDKTKNTIRENRYYLKENKLIYWLDDKKESQDIDSPEAEKMLKEILNDSRVYQQVK